MSDGIITFLGGQTTPFTTTTLRTRASDASTFHLEGDSRTIVAITFTPTGGATLTIEIRPEAGDHVVDTTGVGPTGAESTFLEGSGAQAISCRRLRYPDKVGGYEDVDVWVLTEEDVNSPARQDPEYVPEAEAASDGAPAGLGPDRRFPLKVTIVHP